MSVLLALYPVVGLAFGAIAAGVAAMTGSVAPALAGPAGVLALEAVSRLASRGVLAAGGPLGGPLGAVLLVVRLIAAVGIPRPAVGSALMLASMLGRWAVVVLRYGGVPIADARSEPPSRVGFGEFGWASATAFAVTLSLAEAAGLVVLVVAALVTLAVRLVSHRRLGGVSGRTVGVAAGTVEAAVLAALAALAAVLGR